jgi:dTDP-4-amino-4,6-dideoxygalactose transaminase
MIPFSDPSAFYLAHKKEIDEAIQRVLKSGWFVLSKEVKNFEKEFAAFHGEDFHAVGVGNGTDAIALCLRGIGLGSGDEVITSSHTAVATVAGIEQAGCTPVFADIDPHTRCIDPNSVRERVGSSTRAIMPVHIYGQPAEMHKILEIAKVHNLALVEDCSQAHGA